MQFKIKRLHWVLAAGILLAVAVPVASSASASHVPKCMDETPTIVGTQGDDVIVGTSDDDVIDGGPGVDGLIGGPGDDILDGSESEDLFGEDPDFAFYVESPAAVQA